MKIYTTLNIGEFHTNHCEDFLIVESLGSDKKLIAVFDGCTMAKESVFASNLFGKILRSIAKRKFYEEFVTSGAITNLRDELKGIIKNLIEEIKHIKSRLDLDVNELLSTKIVGGVDTDKCNAEIITIGDGLICADGDITEFEQGDKPDYLGYHLAEDFNSWFDKQEQIVTISSFSDLSISTDGIFTFKNLKDKSAQKSEKNIIEYLLINRDYSLHDNMLQRKLLTLKSNWNHVVTDDLAIIRLLSI
jgi:hypothetical protein